MNQINRIVLAIVTLALFGSMTAVAAETATTQITGGLPAVISISSPASVDLGTFTIDTASVAACDVTYSSNIPSADVTLAIANAGYLVKADNTKMTDPLVVLVGTDVPTLTNGAGDLKTSLPPAASSTSITGAGGNGVTLSQTAKTGDAVASYTGSITFTIAASA
jgi:hypothetical protein